MWAIAVATWKTPKSPKVWTFLSSLSPCGFLGDVKWLFYVTFTLQMVNTSMDILKTTLQNKNQSKRGTNCFGTWLLSTLSGGGTAGTLWWWRTLFLFLVFPFCLSIFIFDLFLVLLAFLGIFTSRAFTLSHGLNDEGICSYHLPTLPTQFGPLAKATLLVSWVESPRLIDCRLMMNN